MVQLLGGGGAIRLPNGNYAAPPRPERPEGFVAPHVRARMQAEAARIANENKNENENNRVAAVTTSTGVDVTPHPPPSPSRPIKKWHQTYIPSTGEVLERIPAPRRPKPSQALSHPLERQDQASLLQQPPRTSSSPEIISSVGELVDVSIPTPPMATPPMDSEPQVGPVARLIGQGPSSGPFKDNRLPPYKNVANFPLRHSRRNARGRAMARAQHTTGGNIPMGSDWRRWPAADFKAHKLPTYTTVNDIWRAFSGYGNIELIDIFKFKNDVIAKVRFSPPPHEALGQSDLRGPNPVIHFSNHQPPFRPPITIERPNFNFQVPSPVRLGVTYPETITLVAQQLDFGVMHTSDTMMVRKQVEGTPDKSVSIKLKLGPRRIIDIQFTLIVAEGQSSRMEQYRFQIPLLEISKVLKVDDHTSTVSLVLSSSNPPQLFRQLHDVTRSFSDKKWVTWDSWYRQTDVVADPAELRYESISLRKPKAIIDFGRWTTYQLRCSRGRNPEGNVNMFLMALQDYNIKVETVSELSTTFPEGKKSVWDYIDESRGLSRPSTSALDDLASMPPLPFTVRYQLEACISQGMLSEYNLSREFVERLLYMNERQATELLEFVVYNQERIFEPMSIFKMTVPKGSHTKSKIPAYCVYTRKVTVTPTCVYYSTPNVETSNRVVRQFNHIADRFIRVQFTDERNEGPVRSSPKCRNDEVFTRIKRAMTNGITIGDRTFEFLAFGNSQFREQGAYFFCPTKAVSTSSIREWMGSFNHIKVVAKYAARLGQCFSTTRAITGTKVAVLELPEVTNGDYTFTDGVGKMSGFVARMIHSDLSLPTRFPPSVVQFRLGGSKGVLAVDPGTRARQVRIRKSQYKFKAAFDGLEIIRWSQFSSAKLNRQLILILSDLGVKDQVFLQKQYEMLARLQNAMQDGKEAVAMLQQNVDPNGATVVIAQMVLDGFMKFNDPFVLSLLRLWRSWCIKYLKEKAHILIEQSAFLLGCTDETKTLRGHFDKLQPGHSTTIEQKIQLLPEIFVQISDLNRPGHFKIIEGVCIVGRNPSLHAGDLRIVKAINVPGLHHLRDVVVFPQTGDRDLPSMCSGGDLDGDDYFVIWDADMLPKEWNHPAMDFKAPDPLIEENGVTIDAITTFFIQYIKNDSLPRIAHAHMAHADYNSSGVKSDECLKLARLHSLAVDYVKTGYPAVMPPELAPRKWPHFMEKRHKSPDQIYVSKKVLGQLFDSVEKIDFVPQYSSMFDNRVLCHDIIPSEAHLLRAAEIKELYDDALRRILAQHSIKTEFEVWSTFVLSHSDTKKDYKFHEEIGELSNGLKDRFRAMCIEAAGGKSQEQLAPFVIAMYTATSDEFEEAKEMHQETIHADGTATYGRTMTVESMPLISFAWLFPEVMTKIVKPKPKEASTKEEESEVVETFITSLATDVDRSSSESASTSTSSGTKSNGAKPSIQTAGKVVTSAGVVRPGDLLVLFDDKSSAESTRDNTSPTPSLTKSSEKEQSDDGDEGGVKLSDDDENVSDGDVESLHESKKDDDLDEDNQYEQPLHPAFAAFDALGFSDDY